MALEKSSEYVQWCIPEGKTTFWWGKWRWASRVSGYTAIRLCLRRQAAWWSPPPTSEKLEIFRRCGGLRAIPTLSSCMNLGQRFAEVNGWNMVKRSKFIKQYNFGGGFSSIWMMESSSLAGHVHHLGIGCAKKRGLNLRVAGMTHCLSAGQNHILIIKYYEYMLYVYIYIYK